MDSQQSSLHAVDRVAIAAPSSRSGAVVRVLGSWRFWLPCAAVFFVFAGVFFASSASFSVAHVESACGQPPPDVQFFSSGQDVSQFLDGCGSEGRAAYRNMQIADLFYPAVFGLFLASSLALSVTRFSLRSDWVSRLVALPLVAAGFDYVENAFAWIALLSHPGDAATNQFLGLASAAKTATFWVSGLVLVASLGIGVVRWMQGTIRGAKPAYDHVDARTPHVTSV